MCNVCDVRVSIFNSYVSEENDKICNQVFLFSEHQFHAKTSLKYTKYNQLR